MACADDDVNIFPDAHEFFRQINTLHLGQLMGGNVALGE